MAWRGEKALAVSESVRKIEAMAVVVYFVLWRVFGVVACLRRQTRKLKLKVGFGPWWKIPRHVVVSVTTTPAEADRGALDGRKTHAIHSLFPIFSYLVDC